MLTRIFDKHEGQNQYEDDNVCETFQLDLFKHVGSEKRGWRLNHWMGSIANGAFGNKSSGFLKQLGVKQCELLCELVLRTYAHNLNETLEGILECSALTWNGE